MTSSPPFHVADRPLPTGRHRAPDIDRHDPAVCPGCIRAGWIADHGIKHMPAVIASHRVDDAEVAS